MKAPFKTEEKHEIKSLSERGAGGEALWGTGKFGGQNFPTFYSAFAIHPTAKRQQQRATLSFLTYGL